MSGDRHSVRGRGLRGAIDLAGIETFPDINTAYFYVAARAWKPFFPIVGFTLLLANFGSGSRARRLARRGCCYGMGRSNALPQSFFGEVDEKNRVPRNNVLLVERADRRVFLEIVAGYKTYSLGTSLRGTR